jgi:hypothetical protein
MNDRFAVSGQCPLRFRERPNCCITATDETGHGRPHALQSAPAAMKRDGFDLSHYGVDKVIRAAQARRSTD